VARGDGCHICDDFFEVVRGEDVGGSLVGMGLSCWVVGRWCVEENAVWLDGREKKDGKIIYRH